MDVQCGKERCLDQFMHETVVGHPSAVVRFRQADSSWKSGSNL